MKIYDNNNHNSIDQTVETVVQINVWQKGRVCDSVCHLAIEC